ncbi:hypothetical protein LZ30DRAFT_694534 [Colletotrichum cereale]|nr:hypothetical protein LZ30DRAFT_694534 [Colletotrichum cereale]
MAMRETEADMDDVPPPPYSETDIYSISGRHSNPSLNSPLTQSHYGDDAASRVSSHASSRSDVIYTPPLTPRTGSTAGPHHHNSNPNLASHAHAAAAASAQSVFAAAYFESRPAPAFSPWDQQLVHVLAVNPFSTPDDVPWPQTWAARDVTQQDWATFTNCLIPHHTAAQNEAVINRKLQAEEEAIAAAASHGGSGDNSPGGPRSISSSHASAQLERIRPDPDTAPGAAVAASGLRREDVEAVVAQWNEGFFRPRVVNVLLTPEFGDLRLPGAWDRSFDRGADSPAFTSAGAGGGPAPVPFTGPHAGGIGPDMQPGPGPNEARGGWSFGGITVTPDGISIGDRIVADSNGIRLGNLIANENGIRFGSNTIPRAQPHFVGPNANWAPPLTHAPSAPSPVPMFGPRPGPGPGPGPGPFPPRPHPHNHAHARHGSGGGTRGRPPGRYPSDQRSVSASSSASSVSSTSSASSVGSLPDYEDLRPAQLPVYKERVASWLAHPDQPVTKTDVAQLCDEIRSAQSADGASEKLKQDDPSAADAPDGDDEKALKAELKGLTQEWRKLKRQQRAARKEKRRERLSPNGPNNFQWGAGPGRGSAPPGGFSVGRGAWAAAFGRGWGRGRGSGNDHVFPPNAGPPHPHGAWPAGGSGKRGPDPATPPVPPPS